MSLPHSLSDASAVSNSDMAPTNDVDEQPMPLSDSDDDGPTDCDVASNNDVDELPMLLSETDDERPKSSTNSIFERAGQCKNGIEMFAGARHLSSALRHDGMEMIEFDIKKDLEHDISKDAVRQNLVNYIEGDCMDYAHIAPPCKSYSCARFPKVRSKKYPSG